MELKDMANEYLLNIKDMEKRLCQYNMQMLEEKGIEKLRKLRMKIAEIENVIFDNYKDYYEMLNYYEIEDDINESKSQCG